MADDIEFNLKENSEINLPSFRDCKKYIINNKSIPLYNKLCSIGDKIVVVERKTRDLIFDLKDTEQANRANSKAYCILKDIDEVEEAIKGQIEPKAGSLNGEHENGIKESQQEPNGESADTSTNEGESVPETEEEILPTIRKSSDKKQYERKIFQSAINKGYMELSKNGKSYLWKKTKALCAYMCGRLYCGDKVTDGYVLSKGSYNLPATDLERLFGLDVGNNRNGLKTPPKDYDIIDELFEENGSK